MFYMLNVSFYIPSGLNQTLLWKKVISCNEVLEVKIRLLDKAEMPAGHLSLYESPSLYRFLINH